VAGKINSITRINDAKAGDGAYLLDTVILRELAYSQWREVRSIWRTVKGGDERIRECILLSLVGRSGLQPRNIVVHVNNLLERCALCCDVGIGCDIKGIKRLRATKGDGLCRGVGFVGKHVRRKTIISKSCALLVNFLVLLTRPDYSTKSGSQFRVEI